MEVADQDETQSKKVFRARKTMKISDRQQLESIHNSLSSSALSSSTGVTSSSTPPPTVVNGKDSEEEQTQREGDTEKNPKEARLSPPASRTPSPLMLSLSLSPSPPSQSPQLLSGSNDCSSTTRSPKRGGKESDRGEGDGEGEKEGSTKVDGVRTADEKKMEGGEVKEKEDSAGPQVKVKEDANPKLDGEVSSPLVSSQDPTISPASPSSSESKDKESKTETEKRTESEEAVTMDTDPAPIEIKAQEDEKSIPAADTVTSSTPSPSPSHAPESDLEVKERFLVLSEEDDNQGEKDEEKERPEVKETEGEEKMHVDMKKDEEKAHVRDSAPPSPTSSPALPPTDADTGHGTLSGKKRALCGDSETDGEKEGDKVVREGKRQKVEGEELEAQLELKIRADTSSRLKLEKVVQQLVEEQLRALQLSVFDQSLQELRDRVEKIDCATKHQQTLNSLQAKIARLAKKFGAANQTKENIRKPQEVTSLTPATNTTPTSAVSTTSTFRSLRTTADSKPINQSPVARPLSATASPAQPKPLSIAAPLASSAPPASSSLVSHLPLIITTAATCDTTSSVSCLAPVASQNQTLMFKTSLANGAVSSQNPPMSQPVSMQPLLIQLPLAVANAAGGSVVTSHSGGLEFIPVSSLGTVSTLSKAKTTTATTFILQKSTPSSSFHSSPAVPQITIARAVYPGGGGIVSVPSSGVSVSTARTPTQCASVAGVSSSSSLPMSSAPAATGGQATSAPPPATVMASKTDNQASNSAVGKPPVQVSRASTTRAVIDLTDEDDDVQVTGVKRAPLQSGLSVASSVSPATQRSTGAPPPLISSSTALGPATGSTMRSSPLGGLHSVNGPPLTVPYRSPQNSPSKVRPVVRNPSPQQQPAPPPLPSPPPAPARLPPEAAHTSLPQQPLLKLSRVPNQSGIVLSWSAEEVDRACASAAVDSYHLYAYHRDRAGDGLPQQSLWKKIGEVKALPLPMACTLTQFVSGSTYYFAVCARDIYGRFGQFCKPQCTDIIGSSSG